MDKKYDYTYFLSGCVNNSEKINLADILDLSPSNILSIKISKSGGPQTIIENAEQIEEICSFLSSAFTLGNKYKELNFSSVIWGGMGDYFLITNSDDSTSHIQIYERANEIQISGRTSQGDIKDKWKIYPLVNFSYQERLKEILSMEEPIS